MELDVKPLKRHNAPMGKHSIQDLRNPWEHPGTEHEIYQCAVHRTVYRVSNIDQLLCPSSLSKLVSITCLTSQFIVIITIVINNWGQHQSESCLIFAVEKPSIGLVHASYDACWFLLPYRVKPHRAVRLSSPVTSVITPPRKLRCSRLRRSHPHT